MDIGKKLKRIRTANIAVNAVVCCGIIAVSGFNPLTFVGGYVITDCLLTLANEAYLRSVAARIAKHPDFDELINDINDYGYARKDEADYARNIVKLAEEKHKKYKEELEEHARMEAEGQKQEEEMREKMDLRKRNVNAIIDSISEFLSATNGTVSDKPKKNSSERQILLKNVTDEFKKLKNNLKTKPETSFMIDGMFPIYTKELIRYVTNDYSGSKDHLDKKCVDVLNEFLRYLKDINKRIEQYKTAEIDIGLDTLLSELIEINKNGTE